MVVSQYFSGWVILGVFLLILPGLQRKKAVSPSPPRIPFMRRAAVLLVTGAVTCSVCLFYYLSLETTPASVAVVLLFQFTWNGIILESIAERRLPSRTSVTSVAILLTGTLLAGGVLGTAISLTTIGVCAGPLCAFCYAVFIFLSGRIEPQDLRCRHLVCSGHVFPFYSVGTSKISTGTATILSSSELPVVLITSVIVLHEAVSWV